MSFVPVADGVLVRTSRRLRTTTTLALRPTGADVRPRQRTALLVDPAWEDDELAATAAECQVLGVRVAAGFATHAHHDHLLWHADLGCDVPRWATARAAGVATRERARLLAEARQDARRYGGTSPGAGTLELLGRVHGIPGTAGTIPDPEGELPAVEVVEHHAHAPGHAALWLPEARVLLAGDMLSDVEVPMPSDEITGGTDLATYREGLERLAAYVARARVLVPGHGNPTTDPVPRLDVDRRYIDALLAGRVPDDPMDRSS